MYYLRTKFNYKMCRKVASLDLRTAVNDCRNLLTHFQKLRKNTLEGEISLIHSLGQKGLMGTTFRIS